MRFDEKDGRMPGNQILYPEDKIPFARLVPMGTQHVVAMFGATVLGPMLMGFDPQLALFFTGVGTLIFIFTTRMKVPSYLGPSFAFIGPVLAVTGGDATKVPLALCGIAGAPRLASFRKFSKRAGGGRSPGWNSGRNWLCFSAGT